MFPGLGAAPPGSSWVMWESRSRKGQGRCLQRRVGRAGPHLKKFFLFQHLKRCILGGEKGTLYETRNTTIVLKNEKKPEAAHTSAFFSFEVYFCLMNLTPIRERRMLEAPTGRGALRVGMLLPAGEGDCGWEWA